MAWALTDPSPQARPDPGGTATVGSSLFMELYLGHANLPHGVLSPLYQ